MNINYEYIHVYEFPEERSSLIRGAGQSPYNNFTLRLKLSTDDVNYHDYLNVPPKYYAGLLMAESMGAYYNRFIRGKYQHILTPIPPISEDQESTIETRIEIEEETICDLAKAITEELINRSVTMIQDFLATVTSD